MLPIKALLHFFWLRKNLTVGGSFLKLKNKLQILKIVPHACENVTVLYVTTTLLSVENNDIFYENEDSVATEIKKKKQLWVILYCLSDAALIQMTSSSIQFAQFENALWDQITFWSALSPVYLRKTDKINLQIMWTWQPQSSEFGRISTKLKAAYRETVCYLGASILSRNERCLTSGGFSCLLKVNFIK